jgi:predicted transcriptional regulator
LFLKEFEINKEVRKTLSKETRKQIVRIYSGFEEKKENFLICELMQGNLNDQKIEIMEIKKILEDIGGVLREMHLKGFVHFDISPGKYYKRTFSTKLQRKSRWKNSIITLKFQPKNLMKKLNKNLKRKIKKQLRPIERNTVFQEPFKF